MVRMQHIVMHGPGLSVRGGGRGFPPVTNNVAPGYFHRKIEEIKMEPKEIPSCLIPRLLVAFIQQLEILVTALIHGPCKVKHIQVSASLHTFSDSSIFWLCFILKIKCKPAGEKNINLKVLLLLKVS